MTGCDALCNKLRGPSSGLASKVRIVLSMHMYTCTDDAPVQHQGSQSRQVLHGRAGINRRDPMWQQAGRPPLQAGLKHWQMSKSLQPLLCALPSPRQLMSKLMLQAGFLLGTTLEEHPAMAPVIVREMERFLFRPGIAPRARYYAIVFLNQLQLSHDDARGEPQPRQ